MHLTPKIVFSKLNYPHFCKHYGLKYFLIWINPLHSMACERRDSLIHDGANGELGRATWWRRLQKILFIALYVLVGFCVFWRSYREYFLSIFYFKLQTFIDIENVCILFEFWSYERLRRFIYIREYEIEVERDIFHNTSSRETSDGEVNALYVDDP